MTAIFTGYYSPSSGGGCSSAPTMQVDFEAPESKDPIDIKKYINCFGSKQSAFADYTITISVDLPVDNDPSKIFSWSDASPGHTFVELHKNDSSSLVQQNIGFYPDQSWKTVAGGNVSAKVADDGNHEYQANFTITVTERQFANALNAATSYRSLTITSRLYLCRRCFKSVPYYGRAVKSPAITCVRLFGCI